MRNVVVFAALGFVLSFAPPAHADTITLNVSAPLASINGFATCATSGCALGGTLVLDNTAGSFLAADVSVIGGPAFIGPFTNIVFQGQGGSDYFLILFDASSTDKLQLGITRPNLVGFVGGPLDAPASFINFIPSQVGAYQVTSGSLSPVPEPGSLGLVAMGIGSMLAIRKRRRVDL